MFDALRAMVAEEMSLAPAFAIGRTVEPVGTQDAATFRGQSQPAVGVRNLSEAKLQSMENGLFVHLGNMQAVGFWRSSHVSVGGADPPVISV